MATPVGKNQYGDDIYSTPNGQKTGTQITQELSAAGWDGKGGDPVAVYNNTAAAGKAAPTASQTSNTSTGGTVRIDPNDIAAVKNFFGQTAGFSRDELAERARQFDQDLAFRKQQWEREGLSRLEIDQRAQSLREWQAQQDVQLQRSALGLNYLTTASQMGGPASVFQQADFLKGARQRGDVPGFLGDLASNTQAPAFTGAGNASIIPQTPGGLTLQLGGAGGGAVTIPTSGQPGAQAAPVPGTAGSYDPAQLAAIDTYMNAQIGSNNWSGGTFHSLVSQGVPLADAIRKSAQGMGGVPLDPSKYQMPNLPSPMAAASTPAASAPVVAGVPSTTAATPNTATSLGTDPAGYSYDQALNQIGSIFKAGPTSLAPGSLERLDPNELAILKSGAQKLGYDDAAWLRAYQKAGIGQAAGSAF